MPWQTVRLIPGVRVEQTPTLLQASLVSSQLIRWRGGLPEKLGGWTQFLAEVIAGIGRQLWAWADFRNNDYLAVGTTQALTVFSGNWSQDITPQFNQSDAAPNFSTQSGSPLVTIVDAVSQASIYDGAQIANHVAIGGLVLYGHYQIVAVSSATTYMIDAGANATSTVNNTGTLATFTTANNSSFITVTLPNHGLTVGQSQWVMKLPVTVGGVTLVPGFYDILAVGSSSTFTIAAAQTASSTATVTDNSGNVQLTYWVAPVPPVFAAAGWGQGAGGWGGGSWGTATPPPPVTGTKVAPDDWSLANFGEDLVSNPAGGPLFDWDVDSGLRGSRIIKEAPITSAGFFIAMPQQMVVAYGCSPLANNGTSIQDSLIQDPMMVRWCDAGDDEVWVASASNQAGSFRLGRGSKIVAGIQAPQQAMLWTDIGLWLMTYVGYPDVWGFFEIAQQCGLIGKNAVAVVGGKVIWMGYDGFWMYISGGTVQRLPCDVWDIVFPAANHINLTYADRIRAAGNTSYDEVTFYFPSLTSPNGENDTYVRVNVLTGEWDYGSLAVTEWIDNNIFGPPLSGMLTSDGQSCLIMQHETSADANGQPLVYSYQTGFFMLMEGEDKPFVDFFLPDMKWSRFGQSPGTSAQVAITLYGQDDPDNPNSPPTTYGPYYVTNATGAIEVRVRQRYLSLAIEGSDLGSFSRLGGCKFRVAPDGRN